jgi:hypothetical protein
VLFTDEACFGRDGIINIHNQHQWAEENPHAVIRSRHHQQFSINMWTGIVGGCLVGQHVSLHQLKCNHNQDFLLYDLSKLLEEVPLAVRAQLWYMHDGALAQFSCAVRDVLNNAYHD